MAYAQENMLKAISDRSGMEFPLQGNGQRVEWFIWFINPSLKQNILKSEENIIKQMLYFTKSKA